MITIIPITGVTNITIVVGKALMEVNKLKLHDSERIDEFIDTRYTGDKWYVLYTRSRHEKLIESQLLAKGTEAFVPKITLRKRWSDRMKDIEEPLFKSYCFARFKLCDRLKVIFQKGVVKIVNFNGQFVSVEESVINSLKILAASALRIDPYPYLKEGDRVAIRKGPFKGLEGYIVEKRNKNTTLVVSIDAIAASVKCVVDIDYVDLA